MDEFKAKLAECGPGGIKCRCCAPRVKGKKDRSWTRSQKRALRKDTRDRIESETLAKQQEET